MSNNSSPRLSFSHDLIQPANPSPHNEKSVHSPNADFDFNVCIELGSTSDPSPADELFSGGRIIPLLLRNPDPNPNPDPITGPVNRGGKEKSGGKKSLWRFGRSASLNCARSGMMKINFLRSYSTGSDPNPNPIPKPSANPNPNPNPNRKRTRAKSCYFEGGRMNPVPLLPKEKGLIGILLCNCVGGGGNNKGMEYY